MNLANTPSIQWQGDVRSNSTLDNTNGFLKVIPEAKGIKMSNDGAGSFDLMTTVTKDGRTLTAVMLGASSEDVLYSEMQTLLNTCFSNTKIVPIVAEGTVMAILNYDDVDVRAAAKSGYSVCMATTNAAVTRLQYSSDENGSSDQKRRRRRVFGYFAGRLGRGQCFFGSDGRCQGQNQLVAAHFRRDFAALRGTDRFTHQTHHRAQ